MERKLLADFMEVVGSRTVRVDVDGDVTVSDTLDAPVRAHPVLESRVSGDDDELCDHINVLQNGEATALGEMTAAGDELALFPPISDDWRAVTLLTRRRSSVLEAWRTARGRPVRQYVGRRTTARNGRVGVEQWDGRGLGETEQRDGTR